MATINNNNINNEVAVDCGMVMEVVPNCDYEVPRIIADLLVRGNPNQLSVYVWKNALLVKYCIASARVAGEIVDISRADVAKDILIVDESGVVMLEVDVLLPVMDGFFVENPVEISDSYSGWKDVLSLSVEGFDYSCVGKADDEEMEFDPLNFEVVSGVIGNPGGVNLLNTDGEELSEGVRVKKLGKISKHHNLKTVTAFADLISSGSKAKKKSNVVIEELKDTDLNSDDTAYLFECSGDGNMSNLDKSLKELEDLGNVAQFKESAESGSLKKDEDSVNVGDDMECQVIEESSSAPTKKGVKSTPLRKSTRTKRKLVEVKLEDAPKSTAKKPKRSKAVTVSKEILTEMECSEKFLKEEGLEDLYELLKAQGWHKLCETQESVCPEAVKEFYSDLTLVEGKNPALVVKFKDNSFTLSSRELASYMDLKHEGFDQFVKNNVWPESAGDKLEYVQRICKLQKVPKGTAISSTSMDPKVKILHKLLVSNFIQRGAKPYSVQHEDLLILDRLLKREQINLPKLIIHQMYHSKGLTHVGYSRVIKKVLQENDLYEALSGEEQLVVKEFDPDIFKKMGMRKDPVEGWVKKSVKEESRGKSVFRDDTDELSESSEFAEGSNLSQRVEDLEKGMTSLQTDVGSVKLSVVQMEKDMKEGFKDLKETFKALMEK